MGPQPRDVLLDRVLAIVSGEVITLSDARVVTAFGLVTPRPGDATAAAVAALIERQLMLGEANRYAAPDPPQGAVDRRLDEVRRRLAPGEGFEATLGRTGMTATRLRDFIRDDLRIDAYLDQRFGGAAQPTEEEVAAYYGAHQAQLAQEGFASLDAASAVARTRVRDERRRALVADWLDRLRRRADIRELYLTGVRHEGSAGSSSRRFRRRFVTEVQAEVRHGGSCRGSFTNVHAEGTSRRSTCGVLHEAFESVGTVVENLLRNHRGEPSSEPPWRTSVGTIVENPRRNHRREPLLTPHSNVTSI